MPILPIDSNGSFLKTLGIMLYPGDDDADRRNARAFASHQLADPIAKLYAHGLKMSETDLVDILAAGGIELFDLETRRKHASWFGRIFAHYFALSAEFPRVATWENAFKYVKVESRTGDAPRTRSAFMDTKKRYAPVAHLLGAWSMRGESLYRMLDCGYSAHDDFQAFLSEAYQLLDWWRWHAEQVGAHRSGLPTRIWDFPKGWQERPRAASGRLIPPRLTNRTFLNGLTPVGRPAGNS